MVEGIMTCDKLFKISKYISLRQLESINDKAFRKFTSHRNHHGTIGWRFTCIDNEFANPTEIICTLSTESLLCIDEDVLQQLSLFFLNYPLHQKYYMQRQCNNSFLKQEDIYTNNMFTLRALCMYLKDYLEKKVQIKSEHICQALFEHGKGEDFFSFTQYSSCIIFLLFYNKILFKVSKNILPPILITDMFSMKI